MKKLLLLSLFITLLIVGAKGEPLRLSRLNIEGGLTNNKINAVTRSRDGFLWLGTVAGLLRHDGYNYRLYYINTDSVSHTPCGENDIDNVIEDTSGRLWLFSHNAWYVYNPATDRIEHNADSLLASMGVRGKPKRIEKDAKSGMWVFTDTEEVFHIPANRPVASAVDFGTFPSLEGKEITAFADSGRGMTAVTDLGELYEISHFTHRVERYDNHIPTVTGNNERLVHSIFYDREGLAWIYTTERLWLFDSNLRIWKEHELPGGGKNMVVKSIYQDSFMRLWLARDHHGLERICRENNRYVFTGGADYSTLPSNSTVTSLFEDHNGILWIGTYKHGVFMANESAHKFSLDKLPDTNCLLARKDGSVWVGTDADGLMLWNPADGSCVSINDPADSSDPAPVTALYEDEGGTLWIGSFSRGLRTMRDGHFTRLVTGSAMDNAYVWAISPSGDGSLWIGTLTGGIFHYNPVTGEVRSYTTADYPLNSDSVLALEEASDGTLYAATAYGVFTISPDGGTVKQLAGLPPVTVNDIMIDHRGLVWIASQQGVDIFDPKTATLHSAQYMASPGARFAIGLQEDKSGAIWVAEGGKLVNFEVAYNPTEGTITTIPRVYDSSDGLQNVDFNHRSFSLLPSGELLVGGLNGVSRFNPNEITYNQSIPKVMFSSISVNGKEIGVGEEIDGRVVLPSSLNSDVTVSLGHDTYDFTIAFASDNYILPGKTIFHYRLEGLDEDWKSAPAGSNFATYTHLPPGKYRLAVRAVNNDGIGGDETYLDIEVRPPFYRSTIAYIFYFLLIIGSVAGSIIYVRIHERRKFNERHRREALKKEEELNQLKFKFFTSVSHDLRTPLTLIISPLDSMLREATDDTHRMRLSLMRKNAGHLLDMVNQLLDFRKSEMAGLKLHSSPADLALLISNSCNSFAELSNAKNIEVTYHTDIASLPTVVDEDKIYKVMLNLLGNAAKFTPEGGKIDISLALSPDKLCAIVRVADTGRGISDEEKPLIFERFYQGETERSSTGYGIGLSLVKDYISLHNGTITVSDNKPAGTVFEFIIPLHLQPGRPVVMKEEPKTEEAPATSDATTPERTSETEGAKEQPAADSGKDTAETASAPQQAPPAMPKPPARSEKPLALVIDDNTDMLRFLKDGLSGDFRVFTATDGEAALTLLGSVKPAIIITDVMMPGLDGIELCRRVKGNPDLAGIPIIALSAKTEEQAKVEMLTIGADDYITKPFNIELLILRMKRLVALTTALSGRRLITPEPGNIDITPLDEKMVEKAIKYVVSNMKRTDLSVEELSSHLGMSRVHLYKKLKTVTGKTPIEFIRLIRLKRAAQLLRESQLNVSEVAYSVGFNNPKYFARYFKEEYNLLPSDYKDLKEQTTFRPL